MDGEGLAWILDAHSDRPSRTVVLSLFLTGLPISEPQLCSEEERCFQPQPAEESPPDDSFSACSSTNRARWALTARSSSLRSPLEWADLDLLPPLLLPLVRNGPDTQTG